MALGNSSMSKKYKGSCLCGGISYEVSSFSDLAANCHCTMCRKFHGAAFSTLVEVSGLHWLTGKDLLKSYLAENGTTRFFCGCCGSSIGFLAKGQPMSKIEIAISTFDSEIPVKTDAHIYTNYKACWYQINDHLPEYKEGRESVT
jgi:hypothetical protein